MDIDIMEYVNAEEIKDAILSGLRAYASSEAERVITNAGYELATDIVNKNLGPDAAEDIAKVCKKQIAKLSEYTIFRAADIYGRRDSPAQVMLQQAIRDNKDILDASVKKALHNLTKSEIVDIVKSGKIKLTVGS